MFDVLPPDGSDQRSSGTSRRQRRLLSSKHRSSSQDSEADRTVQVEWKLPARLRKPIRHQLAKERRRKRERRAITGFQRRPLNTRQLTSSVKRTLKPARNVGAEHHTGDVYKEEKPSLRIAMPPYMGGFSGKASSERTTYTPARSVRRKQKSSVPSQRSARPARPARRPQPQRAHRRAEEPWQKAVLMGDRDIPYQWDEGGRSEPTHEFFERGEEVSFDHEEPAYSVETVSDEGQKVHRPRRFLSIPISLNILPGVGRSRSRTTKKKFRSEKSYKAVNAGILIVGCLLSAGLVWNLQGAGRGFRVLGSIQERSRAAYERVLSAQSALAETDFSASEAAFTDAQTQLASARAELDEALAASRYILRFADVTGTVRSGENLLAAGEAITRAGQHVSRGMEPLVGTSVLAEDEGGPTVIDAIERARWELTQARDELANADEALSSVGSPLLPDDISEQVDTLKTSVPRGLSFLDGFLEQSDLLLTVLGAEREREYLLLFANNHELRPNGGFMGSLALVGVDRGVVEDINVQTVYDPDGQLQELIAPPNPLSSITNRWYLRDTNWFVDYAVSARKSAEFFEKEGGPTVDGVILITPEVIRSLIGLTGPIQVPGYDVEVSAENFYEVVQAQVTYEYDEQANRPKQFLADLTPILLNRLFEGDVHSNIELLGSLTSTLGRKDMLLYFKDDEVQAEVEKLGWAGRLPKDAQGFFAVNNANIGGHKSDQFIEQEIDFRSEVRENGDVEVVATIRRTHRGPSEVGDYDYPEGENPAIKDNVVYQRVLVPKGAELLEADGFSKEADVPQLVVPDPELDLVVDPDVAEWQRGQSVDRGGTMVGVEAGYTFFANWMITKPGETSVGLYRYVIPKHADLPGIFDDASKYSTYIAKQPGDFRTEIRASVMLPDSLNVIHTAPDDGVTVHEGREIVYRGLLTGDVVVGGVFEKE